MSIVALLLALFSLFGGSSDLLDFVSTTAYWQSKQVEISVAAMSAELDQGQSPDVAALIDQLASDDPQARTAAKTKLSKMGMAVMSPLRQAAEDTDPEIASAARDLIAQIGSQSKIIAVRRLMAIRTLGELGDLGGEGVLKPLLKSPAMFEADYAAAAIAAIEHHPYARPGASDAERGTDAWNLPQNDQGVFQISSCGGSPTRLETLVAYVTPLPGPQQNALVTQFSREFTTLAELVGNFRLQVMTVGFPDPILPGQLNGVQWNAVVVLRGQYDSAAVAAALKRLNFPAELIDGQVYFQSILAGFFMPGDDRMVLVVGQNFNRRPMAVRSANDGRQTHHDSRELAPLITAADKSGPIWGVMKVTPAIRNAVTWIAAFDTVSLQSKVADSKLQIRLSASGNNPGDTSKCVADINAAVGKAVAQPRPAFAPPMSMREMTVLQSVKCEADGANATLLMQLPLPPFPALHRAEQNPGQQP